MSTGGTVVMQCVDCGSDREVKVQDAFQVKRCATCQVKYRRKLDALRRKAKKATGGCVLIDGGTLEVFVERFNDKYRLSCHKSGTTEPAVWEIEIEDGVDHKVISAQDQKLAVKQAYEALGWFQDGRWTEEHR